MVQQGSQPDPVSRVEPHTLPVEKALQNHELVPQGEDLGVLIAVAAREHA
jgi:hypothetical protein